MDDGKRWQDQPCVNPSTGAVSLLHTISEVVTNGEGGLLGMVLHPNFTSIPHVFVAYNYNSGGNYREKVVRFTYSGGTLNSPLTIIENIPANSIHNGCRLEISPDMKLFITTGDASNTSLPQNLSSFRKNIASYSLTELYHLIILLPAMLIGVQAIVIRKGWNLPIICYTVLNMGQAVMMK